jgi:hypothetical protein
MVKHSTTSKQEAHKTPEMQDGIILSHRQVCTSIYQTMALLGSHWARVDWWIKYVSLLVWMQVVACHDQ